MYSDAMNGKSRIKRITRISAVAMVVFATIILIYVKSKDILYAVAPEMYFKYVMVSSYEEIKPLAECIMSDEIHIDGIIKVREISADGNVLGKLKGVTVRGGLEGSKESGVYTAEAYAGVGGIKMFGADIYMDKHRVSVNEKHEFTWQQIQKRLNTDIDIYGLINRENSKNESELRELLKKLEVSLVDEEEKKFKLAIKDSNYYVYIFINDKHKIKCIANDYVRIDMSGKEHMCENMSLYVGDCEVKMEIEIAKNKVKYNIKSLLLRFELKEKEYKGTFGGNIDFAVF